MPSRKDNWVIIGDKQLKKELLKLGNFKTKKKFIYKAARSASLPLRRKIKNNAKSVGMPERTIKLYRTSSKSWKDRLIWIQWEFKYRRSVREDWLLHIFFEKGTKERFKRGIFHARPYWKPAMDTMGRVTNISFRSKVERFLMNEWKRRRRLKRI